MYRQQQRNPGPIILRMIALGILMGIGFVLYQNANTPAASPPPSPAAATLSGAPTAFAATLPPAPTIPAPLASDLVQTTLFIPTAGVYATVVQVFLDGVSWDISQLGQNVGHLQGTAWLDRAGNIVLSGHVEMGDGRPGVFAPIKNLSIGDLLILQRADDERRYSVVEVKTVAPDDLSVLYPTPDERLTLITCDRYDFLSNSYQERVVVVATRIDP